MFRNSRLKAGLNTLVKELRLQSIYTEQGTASLGLNVASLHAVRA